MESIQCFYCKKKLDDHECAIAHALEALEDEDEIFALLITQADHHYLPKCYTWKPGNHNQDNV